MIAHSSTSRQLPNAFQIAFDSLHIGHHLRRAGITKNLGFSCLSLFRIILMLVFQHKNWFRMLESQDAHALPSKDAVYRFLNNPRFSWRKFLLSLSTHTVQQVQPLTSDRNVRVLIVDDSVYERGRSRAVELLARVHDHTVNRFVKGFRMLTLGWSDGHTFVPIDFSLLSSSKKENRYTEANVRMDKRTVGYKRRQEAIHSTPDAVIKLIGHALQAGIPANYVLMDSWFTHLPLLHELHQEGLFVIGMVKAMKQRYQWENQLLTLRELFQIAKPNFSRKQILSSVRVELEPGLLGKMVFVKHRHKKREWLAILSTDVTLSDEEIIRIYGMRWDIEVFFKACKSLLRLGKEFQGRSYDMMVAHTTIVFTRYIMLSWESRKMEDPRTLGGLFYLMCDELVSRDWRLALHDLWSIVEPIAQGVAINLQQVQCQLLNWIASLPSYIKGYRSLLTCES